MHHINLMSLKVMFMESLREAQHPERDRMNIFQGVCVIGYIYVNLLLLQ